MKSSKVKRHKRKSSYFWPAVILCGVLAVGVAAIFGNNDESSSPNTGISESKSQGAITSVGMGTQTYTGSYRGNAATCSVTVTLTTGDYDPKTDSVKTTAVRTENCVPDPPPPSSGGK